MFVNMKKSFILFLILFIKFVKSYKLFIEIQIEINTIKLIKKHVLITQAIFYKNFGFIL
jgi:hypothetical protein